MSKKSSIVLLLFLVMGLSGGLVVDESAEGAALGRVAAGGEQRRQAEDPQPGEEDALRVEPVRQLSAEEGEGGGPAVAAPEPAAPREPHRPEQAADPLAPAWIARPAASTMPWTSSTASWP